MKQAMINYMQQEKNDELYTPTEAILPILKYLDHNKIYWECTDFGESNITKVLKENGFKVINTSKKEIDFLKDKANFEFDVIITNPPYSLKNEFLKKCYEYQKPFMLLLPLTALEGKERNKLYRKYGIEVIVLDKRINFMKEKKNVWFNTSWFCHGICDKLLNFEKVGGVVMERKCIKCIHFPCLKVNCSAENTEVCDLYETEVSRAIKKLREEGYMDFERTKIGGTNGSNRQSY